MKFATQIISSQPPKSSWKPGIHRSKTKLEAIAFTNAIISTGGRARTMRQKNDGSWEELVTA